MKLAIKENYQPNFGKVQMECDDCIHEKLEKYGGLIADFLNYTNTTAFIGTMGSGKTSLMINFVKKLYKKCFHKIYVFMPKYSRQSLKDNIFDVLDPSQLYDELNEATIADVYSKVQLNSSQGLRSLIIYDDVQKALKNTAVLLSLKNLISNQRHLRCCNFIMLQNYFSLDKSLRELINNIVMFKLGKSQTQKVFDECVESAKDHFETIRDLVYEKKYDWMFISIATQRIFKRFDEIIINNDEI